MEWEKYIHSDPEIFKGKPVIKGTRLSVDFILDLLGQGWSKGQILKSYPSLTIESINAAQAYGTKSRKPL